MDRNEINELMENQQRLLTLSRIGLVITALTVVILLGAILILAPKAHMLLNRAEAALGDVQEFLVRAEGSLSEVDVLIENANNVVVDNTEAVNEALGHLNSVDFDTLNKAINDLADVVEPLARLTNFFN